MVVVIPPNTHPRQRWPKEGDSKYNNEGLSWNTNMDRGIQCVSVIVVGCSSGFGCVGYRWLL